MSDLVDELRKVQRLGGDTYSSAEVIGLVGRAADEIVRLQARLEQIAIVCTDNMDRSCNHRMALDFVRQIANTDTE